MDMDKISEVIHKIYATSLGTSSWRDALEYLVQITDSESGLFLNVDPSSPEGNYSKCLHNVDKDHQFAYETYFNQLDRCSVLLAQQPGEVFCTDDLFKNNNHQFFIPELEYDFMKKYDYDHRICMSVPASDTSSILFYLNRGKKKGAYQNIMKVRQQLEIIQPHIEQAIGIKQKLDTKNNIIETFNAGYAGLQTGLLLFDCKKNVLFVNDKAEQFLDQYPYLKVSKNKLRASRSELDKKIQKNLNHSLNVSNMLSHQPSQAFSVTDKRNVIYDILISPFSLEDHDLFGKSTNVRVAMFITLRTESPLPANLLKSMYQLTDTEAEVLMGLVSGLSAHDISDYREVAISTIRTHIKSLMRKLDVNRQSDLIRVVLTGPARFHVENT